MKPYFFIVVLGVSYAPAVFAADYWVTPGGSDGNAGTMASPWLTIQNAADHAQPGDTVHVANGSYAGFHVDNGGTATQPITFVAAGTSVSITSPNGMTHMDGINVENADWVVIDGFVLNGLPRAGARCALSNHVTMQNLHADANGEWGILTGCCPYVTLQHNVTSNSVGQHGIYVGNSADYPIIRGNVIFGNNANGIHMNGDMSTACDPMPTDGVISHALVEQNVIYDNGHAGGSGINCDGVSDSVIRNNLVYAEHASGISLYQIDAATGAQNDQVINNTIIVAADTGRWGLNINTGSTGALVRNNIFFRETMSAARGSISIDASSMTGFSSDDNLLMGPFTADGDNTTVAFAAWQAMGYDVHSHLATSATVFANVAANDYHLVAGSPAIDQADPTTAPSDDLEGHARPVGSGPDIGCYEYGSTTVVDGGGLPDTGSSVDAAQPTDTGTATTDGGTPIDGGTRADAITSTDGSSHGSGEGGSMSGSCGCVVPGRRSSRSRGAVWALGVALGAVVRRRRRE